MATKPKLPSLNIDFAGLKDSVGSQFQNLNPNDPASWPAVPRWSLLFAVTVAVVAALWFVWLSSSSDELDNERNQETTLRESYKTKIVQAVNLDALKKQREQVLQYVNQLEKQLPSKAEMDALLSDINQAGLGRSLQFELFRPGQVVIKDYYAELPISVNVSGKYHDIGAFASDIAHLSRIVTLNNMSIGPSKDSGLARDGVLSMEATAKTFRYLDAEEVIAQRKANAEGAKKP